MDRRNPAPATEFGPGPGADGPPAGPRGASLRVHVVLYDGVEEQDFVGPVTVFGTVENITQTFVSVAGPRTVHTASGMGIVVSAPWSPRSADVVVVPGGGFGPGSGVDRQIRDGVLPEALADARRPGLVLLGVCTGSLLLAAAGLTAGRPCTTHHVAVAELRARGGNVVGGRVVDDGTWSPPVGSPPA